MKDKKSIKITMTPSDYDALAEYLGVEPETEGEMMFFDMIWENMSEEKKAEVREAL